MKRQDYETARDMSWEKLIFFKVDRLPVKVSDICKECEFELHSYKGGAKLIAVLGLQNQCKISDGFSIVRNGRYYIFYNEKMSVGRIRFTIAHELGHIFLGHVLEGQVTLRNKEPAKSDSPLEQMANVFASRFLAPACVLHALNTVTPDEISKLCDISLQSAEYRAERMGVLNARNKYGLSPLERDVERQFQQFIKKNR